MKDERNRLKISVALKLLTAACAVCGLLKCLVSSGFMGGRVMMRYFTIQSNIWIAAVCIFLSIFEIRALRKNQYTLSTPCSVLQQVFTVSISLTGIIFCFVLVPAFLALDRDSAKWLMAYQQVLLHIVVPVLAVVDLLIFTRHRRIKMRRCLLSCLPPLYYLGYALIGYVKNWDFGMGNNYPYFFMNYSSPVGLFGVSRNMPYFMGSFYWFIFILALVTGISALYIRVMNRRSEK